MSLLHQLTEVLGEFYSPFDFRLLGNQVFSKLVEARVHFRKALLGNFVDESCQMLSLIYVLQRPKFFQSLLYAFVGTVGHVFLQILSMDVNCHLCMLKLILESLDHILMMFRVPEVTLGTGSNFCCHFPYFVPYLDGFFRGRYNRVIRMVYSRALGTADHRTVLAIAFSNRPPMVGTFPGLESFQLFHCHVLQPVDCMLLSRLLPAVSFGTFATQFVCTFHAVVL